MSPLTARALSTAVLGGLALVLFLTQGLLAWAGFVAWAGFLAAGGDTTAFKLSVAGNIFGAVMAWAALMLITVIEVDPETALWMPRGIAAVAVTLFVLVMASRVELFSSVPAALLGYASVYAALSIPMYNLRGWERLTGMHMYNPFIQVVLSMVGGALVGLLAVRLAAALAKEKAAA